MVTHNKSFSGSLTPGGEHSAAGAKASRGGKAATVAGANETHIHKVELSETILAEKKLLVPAMDEKGKPVLDKDGNAVMRDWRDDPSHYHEAPKPKGQRAEPRDWLIALQHKHKGYAEILTDSKGQKTVRLTYGDGDVTAAKAPTVNEAIMKLAEKMGETTND